MSDATETESEEDTKLPAAKRRAGLSRDEVEKKLAQFIEQKVVTSEDNGNDDLSFVALGEKARQLAEDCDDLDLDDAKASTDWIKQVMKKYDIVIPKKDDKGKPAAGQKRPQKYGNTMGDVVEENQANKKPKMELGPDVMQPVVMPPQHMYPPYHTPAHYATLNARDKFWYDLCRMKEEDCKDMSIPDFLRIKCFNPHEKSIFSKRLEWYRSLRGLSAPATPGVASPVGKKGSPRKKSGSSTKKGKEEVAGAEIGTGGKAAANPYSTTAALQIQAQQDQYNQAYQQQQQQFHHLHHHHHYIHQQQQMQLAQQQQQQQLDQHQQQPVYPGYPANVPGVSPPGWPPQPGMLNGMNPPNLMIPPPYGAPSHPSLAAMNSAAVPAVHSPLRGASDKPKTPLAKGISREGRLVVAEIKELLGLVEESEVKSGEPDAPAPEKEEEEENLEGSDDLPPVGCRETDVLFGRGGAMRKHKGNVMFRGLVKKCQPAYIGALEKNDKMLIARLIVQAVRKFGGRFLKKNERTGVWEPVDDYRVRTKISQALREGAPQLREAAAATTKGSMQLSPSPSSLAQGTMPPFGNQRMPPYLAHSGMPVASAGMWLPQPPPPLVGGQQFPYPHLPPPPANMPSASLSEPTGFDGAEPGNGVDTKAQSFHLQQHPVGVSLNNSFDLEAVKEMYELKEVSAILDPKKSRRHKKRKTETVTELNENDVLIDSANRHSHPGNIKYADLLSQGRPSFCTTYGRELVTGMIVDTVRKAGGRFLKMKDKDKPGVWLTVDQDPSIHFVKAELGIGEYIYVKLRDDAIIPIEDTHSKMESADPIELTDKDVLMGRGAAANHPGNVKYRELVKACQPAYVAAPFNKDKTFIAKLIVQTIHICGGRFLDSDEKTGALALVDHEKARQKTSQAIQTVQKLRYRKERNGTPRELAKEEDVPDEKKPLGINKYGNIDPFELKSLLATTATTPGPSSGSDTEGSQGKPQSDGLGVLLTAMERTETGASKEVQAEPSRSSPRRLDSGAVGGSPKHSETTESGTPKRKDGSDSEAPQYALAEEKLVNHIQALQRIGDTVGLSYNVLKTYALEFAKSVEPPYKDFVPSREWMRDVFSRNKISINDWE